MASIMKRFTLKWPLVITASQLATSIFLVPLYGATLFSFKGNGGKGHSWANYQWLIHADGFYPSLFTSLKLAVLAAIINLLLMAQRWSISISKARDINLSLISSASCPSLFLLCLWRLARRLLCQKSCKILSTSSSFSLSLSLCRIPIAHLILPFRLSP